MHTCLLDVFHDTTDEYLLTIAQAIDVDFNRVVQKAIEQHGRVVTDFDGFAHVSLEVCLLMHDFHGATTQHVTRTYHQGIANFLRVIQRLAFGTRGTVGRLTQIEFVEQFLEALTILSNVNRLGTGANDRRTVRLKRASEFQGCLATILNNDANRLFLVNDFKHVLKCQGFEIQTIRGVIVSRNSLWVAIDHDGFITIVTQGQRGVHAAVIKFDTLADTVGSATEHHDFFAISGFCLALLLIGRVEIGCVGGEFGRAGIDALVNGTYVVLMA